MYRSTRSGVGMHHVRFDVITFMTSFSSQNGAASLGRREEGCNSIREKPQVSGKEKLIKYDIKMQSGEKLRKMH